MDTEPSSPATSSLASAPRPALASGIAGIVLLISVFLNWYTATVSTSGITLPGIPGSISRSVSGWDATDVAKLVALLALIAVAAWAIELFASGVQLPWPAWTIAGVAGVASTLLVLYRIVSKPNGAHDVNISLGTASIHASVGTAFGIWLALIASIVVAAGAYMTMRERT
jgi:hypothetical protein